MQEKEFQVWNWAGAEGRQRVLQQRQRGKVGCDDPVTLDTAWKDTGLWLATTSEDAECSSESLEWLGAAADPSVCAFIQGLSRHSLPACPRLQPHQDRDGACSSPCCGSRRAALSPSRELCCSWNCKCPSFSFWAKGQAGCSSERGWYLVTGTEKPAWKCSWDNAAAALNFTPWPLSWGTFFQLRGENSSLAKCWGAVVADSKFPFPSTAFPQHQPLPVAPCPQTPEGTGEGHSSLTVLENEGCAHMLCCWSSFPPHQ